MKSRYSPLCQACERQQTAEPSTMWRAALFIALALALAELLFYFNPLGL